MQWKQCVLIRVIEIMIIKRYSELKRLKTFEERFEYLKLNGQVAYETFGFDRFMNQMFYRSSEWKHIRDFVITRDNACDLGCDGYDIYNRIIIHHMNPLSLDDITEQTDILLNPEFLITTTHETHNAIHYGSINTLPKAPIERKPNDTCPWR